MVCFYIAITQPRFLFLLDMGLGKTKLIADVLTQLIRERKVTRGLVGVPRVINMDSWEEDLLKHSELEPWPCNVSDTEEKWDRLAYPKGEITMIDYQGLSLATCRKVPGKGKKNKLERDDKKIRHLQKTYDFICLDESHKLGNHGNLWFSVINQLTKQSEYCYATTGTLFGHDLEAMWAQFYLVDRGETFGPNLGLFRDAFFTAKVNPWKGMVYTPRTGMARSVNRMLQHRSVRYDEDEVTELPARVIRPVKMTMGDEQREAYLKVLEDSINYDSESGDKRESWWLKMRQITSGYLRWSDEYGDHQINFKENPKLMALERALENAGRHKMVVCYDYTPTGLMITNHLKGLGVDVEWYYGGTKDKSACRRRFMEDPKCRVFVMNSEAGGTGNDGLQKVARYMVMYETPCSPTTRKQTIKRIHRPGQEGRVFIDDLVLKGTVDMGILKNVMAGIDLHDQVMKGRVTREMLMGV